MKLKTVVTVAGLLAALGSVAEAQTAQERHPRAGTGTGNRAADGMPSHFSAGVNIGSRNFNASIYVYQGFRGYVHYGTWFPFGCGPRRISPWEANALAWGNVARPFPPIDAARGWGYYNAFAPGGVSYASPMPPQEPGYAPPQEPMQHQPEATPVPRVEREPIPEPAAGPEPKKRVHVFPYAKDGIVCPEQIADVANDLINEIFGDYFESIGEEMPYVAKTHQYSQFKWQSTVIRDRKTDKAVRSLNYPFRGMSSGNEPPNYPTGEEIVSYVSGFLQEEFGISVDDFRNIAWSASPKSCFPR